VITTDVAALQALTETDPMGDAEFESLGLLPCRGITCLKTCWVTCFVTDW
jgi:hypothetical protein